jgi:hypothetical protein
LSAVAWCSCLAGFARADDSANPPIHQLIDQSIVAACQAKGLPIAEPASDAEFMRRVYLDLVGTIPSAVEARAFLADAAPDKRAKLIDRLLASPEHGRHLARILNVMLMERRPDKHVAEAQWQEYLRKSALDNKPWDVLVREILSADGADENTRSAAKFVLDRDAEPHQTTRDVGRLFLGVNLQCAQCHDHPLVDGYPQDWYYGLFAFMNRTALFTDKKNKNLVSLMEKADGDVTFSSVFDKTKTVKNAVPRVFEATPIDEPKFEKGQEYSVAPADGVKPVPKFSRRAQLAGKLTGPDVPAFRRNIVNRLWAHMMGRGLVHPVDLHHDDNPPSHPELLAALGDRFAAAKFDVRVMLRELALSQTYQRSSLPPPSGEAPPPESFAVASLKPLTPEQLAWSVMQATGLADHQRVALGDKLNETTLHDGLVGNVAPFISTFAGPAGQPEAKFQATLAQSLFINNGGQVRDWLAPRAGSLVDRLAKLSDPAAIADELYVSVLTRAPTAEERTDLADYLKDRPADQRVAAFQELAWALVASVEFRFNH